VVRILNASLSSGALGRSMMTGAAWTTGSFAYRYALRLLSTIIVTRLLLPEAYGLMSLAMVFVTGLALFSDIGIAPSVIQSKRGDNEEFLRTAWTIKVLRGLFLGLMGCAIAWPAAVIYDEPRLFALICALSLVPVLDGLMSVSQLVCERRIQLKTLNIIEIVCATVATALTIFFAWQLESVWALVIGTLGGAAMRAVSTYLFLPRFAHRLSCNRRDAIEILTFGGWILLATAASFVGTPGLVLIQGALVPITVLGFITLANTLAWAMGELVSLILTKVFFPAMSEIARERPDELRAKMYKILSIVYVGLLPLFLILAVIAHPLINLLYDDRYAVVGDFLAIMAVISALTIMVMPYSNVMLAKGNARVHFQLVAAAAILRIIFLVAGFYLAGTFGMIIGIGVGGVVYNIYIIHVAERHEIGCLKRDYAMLILWTVILLLVSYFVVIGSNYEGLHTITSPT
jgi:O-antigen/teichoic acid export membrane protein